MNQTSHAVLSSTVVNGSAELDEEAGAFSARGTDRVVQETAGSQDGGRLAELAGKVFDTFQVVLVDDDFQDMQEVLGLRSWQSVLQEQIGELVVPVRHCTRQYMGASHAFEVMRGSMTEKESRHFGLVLMRHRVRT